MSNKEIPEGFKMTELGPLPEEWEVVRFSDCRAKQTIKIPPSILKSEYKPTGKYPIVDQSMNFIAGYTDENEKILRQQLPVIIFGDHTRIFKFVDFPFAIGADGTKIIFPKKDTFDSKFLYYYFLNLKIPSKGYNRHFKLLKENIVVRPPLPEQRAIANVLSTVQDAKEKTDAVITATKELKKSLMKHLFAYGPVSLEEAEKVPLNETEIGLVPEEWDVIPLEKLNSEKKISLNPANFPDEIFEYYSIPNYQNSKKPSFEQGASILSQKILLNNGAILFGKLNPRVEKVWKVESDTQHRKIGSTEWIPIFPDNEKVNSGFLYYVEWSRYVMPIAKTLVTGSTPSRQRVAPASFYEIKIPFPSLPVQQKIASILSAVDEKIEKEETKKKALEELFKSLLNNLMTGKLRANGLKSLMS